MNEHTRSVIQHTFEASNEGRIHFGEVIGQLLSVQVESYHVDYRAGVATYYLPDGATLSLGFDKPEEPIAPAFNAAGVRAAILGAQQGRVMYPEFKRLTQRAGCAGYTVWITGKHVSYYGRSGETHIERFPS
ncbi:DUF1398 domain-containing protein [Ideonella paludis]|uniref:DUF1398 family protein n=1 Tax=Ideonella paludis TaxID=1233411 RepID=A0ABS5DY96_9BURK|nr:DUF1398 family protein [Ideonella paludis]MBQ0936116.1 DUF1398 family protein [Ideonella paludis]